MVISYLPDPAFHEHVKLPVPDDIEPSELIKPKAIGEENPDLNVTN